MREAVDRFAEAEATRRFRAQQAEEARMGKKCKKAYSIPIVVALGLDARGSGVCQAGSADSESCQNGLSVSLPDSQCGPGEAAGISCGSGWSASGAYCSGGMYFNP